MGKYFKDINMWILAFSIMTVSIPMLGLHSSLYTIFMIISMFIAIIRPIKDDVYCFAFAIPFTTVLITPLPGFSLPAFIQFVILIKGFLGKKSHVLPVNLLLGTAFIMMVHQMIPILCYDQTILSICMMLSNIYLFYAIYGLRKSGIIQSDIIYWMLMSGSILSCFITPYVNLAEYGSDVVFDTSKTSLAFAGIIRFQALWTDPNFIGMFVLMSITFLLTKFSGLKSLIYILPLIAVLVYYGLLTMSRTFVYGSGLILVIYALSAARKYKSKSVLIYLSLGVAFVSFVPYAMQILDMRTNTDDWSNGRYEYSSTLLHTYFREFPALFSGVGYANELNFLHSNKVLSGASHNTFIDILLEVGLIPLLLIMAYFLSKSNIVFRYIRKLFSLPNLPYLVMAIYLTSFSLLKYEFLYLFLALFFAQESMEKQSNSGSVENR